MSEVVIFCESYPQINSALYLATQNYQEHPVTVVITGHKDLLKFFKVINEKAFGNNINIVYFEIYPAQMAQASSRIIKAFYLIPDIVKERRYLRAIFNRHFARFSGSDIYFSGKCFNPSTFYLLKRLSKENRITYMPDPTYDVVQVLKSTPRNVRELVTWLRYKLVYGRDLMIRKFPYLRNIPTMPDKFFRENVTRIIGQEERTRMLQDFDMDRFRVFDTGDYSVMYFAQDLVEEGFVSDSETVKKTLAGVFNILSKYFPGNRVARKYHPNSRGDKNLIKSGDILPDFIPAEFLYNEKIKIYLGFYSIALANVTKGMVISLMELVPFKNDKMRERLRSELLQWSHTDILFPQSLDEFERILIDIKNHRLKEAK